MISRIMSSTISSIISNMVKVDANMRQDKLGTMLGYIQSSEGTMDNTMLLASRKAVEFTKIGNESQKATNGVDVTV